MEHMGVMTEQAQARQYTTAVYYYREGEIQPFGG